MADDPEAHSTPEMTPDENSEEVAKTDDITDGGENGGTELDIEKDKATEAGEDAPVANNMEDEVEEKSILRKEVVDVDISGTLYEIELADIRRAPSSRLYRYAFSGRRDAMVFKRPQQSFEAVLAYYQTGELHMPLSVCPGAFKTELEFWGIDPQIMMKCCYYRYLSYLDDQETLDRFHEHLFPEVRKNKRCLSSIRNKLWNILDFHDNSIVTKTYFSVCTLMVIVSVLTLALSSVPYFRRNLSKCEMEEYLGKPLTTLEVNITNQSCSDPLTDEVYSAIVVDYEHVKVNRSEMKEGDMVMDGDAVLKSRIDEYYSDYAERNDSMSTRFFFDIDFSNDDFDVTDKELLEHVFDALRPQVGIGHKTVRVQILVYMDSVVLIFFTFDLLMRVLCCPNVLQYFTSIINLCDAIAVLSAYAHIIVEFIRQNEKYEMSNFDILEIFQVLRVLRLLRVVRDVTGFKVLSFSLRVSIKDLFVLVLFMLLGVVIFANFIFFVESEDEIPSVPTGWWWAISTLTTVGYGDVKPKTLYGRVIGGICAITGVVMMAVAIPVFVKTFLLLYAYAALYKKSMNRPEDTHRYIHRQTHLKSVRKFAEKGKERY